MDGIWEVLGITPTADKREIRAAYAVLAKQCHPEEDPQGFKALHEAYQAAMAYAAKNPGRQGNAADSLRREDGQEEGGVQPPSILQKEMTKDGENGHSPKIHRGTAEDTCPESTLTSRTAGEETVWEKESGQKEEKDEEKAPSLLDRLDKIREEELSKSMQSGALMQFSVILSDPKKFRRADAWKAFFLSENFLKEQYQESFADGMLRILENFHTEDNYNIAQMPSGFLMELAIAYALNMDRAGKWAETFYAREVAASIWKMQQTVPVGLLSRPEHKVRMRSFADYIRLKNYNSRGLLTPQNQEDWKGLVHGGTCHYLYELKGKGRHEIYPESRSVCLLDLFAFWIGEGTVPKCVMEYIYKTYGLRGSEHTSTRKLYEPLKKAVLVQYPEIEEALFGEDGKAKLVSAWYRDLMQIISDGERICGETQEMKNRVQALFAREEWPKIRYLPELFHKMELQLLGRSVMPATAAKYLMEFYSDPTGVLEKAWEREQGEVMVEEMIHSIYFGRMVLDMHGNVPNATPYFMDGKLREVHKGKAGEIHAGADAGLREEQGDEQGERESHAGADAGLTKAQGNEQDHARTDVEGNSSAKEQEIFCTDFFSGYPEVLREQDFWHYFLMRGFGCRSARSTGRGKYRRKYITGGNVYLPAYIEYLYQPSGRWQKLFTGAGQDVGKRFAQPDREGAIAGGSEEGECRAAGEIPMPAFCRLFTDDDGAAVPGVKFRLPDGKCLRAEFHLHYVRYFLDGEELYGPAYRFPEYTELVKSMNRVEEQVILLAVTRIDREDCEAAKEMLERLLYRLPLAPVSIPLIAQVLAEGREAELEGKRVLGRFIYSRIESGMRAKLPGNADRYYDVDHDMGFYQDAEENGENRFLGRYYVEEEELCFRAVVRENGFSISRQTDFGWEQVHEALYPAADGGGMLSPEEKCRAAREFLQGMKRPVPVLRAAISLEGMTNEEKAGRILEALKQDALYRGHGNGLLPYAPGYPWEDADTGRDRKPDGGKTDGGEEAAGEAERLSGQSEVTEEKRAEEPENALGRFYREHGGFLPEAYCVLRFGKDDTQDKKEHVFYASMKPFHFALGMRCPDWPSSYAHREGELQRKVKEKHWAVGHFGWGDLTGPDGESVPKIIAVGGSGTYYYYDVVRLLRQESLAGLLARMFDFSKVIAVESYEGELSISRFGGELEYCYGREAFLQSAYTQEKTAADLFTVFTKAEMFGEFAVWMDGLLDGIVEESENLYFEFSAVGDGAYAMQVFLQDALRQERIEEEAGAVADAPVCENPVQARKPLVWKIWQQAGNGAEMSRDFKDALYWYIECGKHGKKLAARKKITAGFDLGNADELVVGFKCTEEGWDDLEWHRNKMKGQEETWERYFGEDDEEDFEEEDFSEEDEEYEEEDF